MSQVLVAVLSIVCLFMLASSNGFVGLWFGLSIFMSLRAVAGFLRYCSELYFCDFSLEFDYFPGIFDVFGYVAQDRDENRTMELSSCLNTD